MLRRLAFLTIVVLVSAFAFIQGPKPYRFPWLRFFPEMPESADNPVTVEGAALGRHLFYDPVLSRNNDLSCASCHKQEKAFSDAPLAFSKGNNDVAAKRNTMPLFNLAWYTSYFWDGRVSSIEKQVFHPVRDQNEMNLSWTIATERIRKSPLYREKFFSAFGGEKIDSVLITKAIGQFLRTLISYRSKFDRVLEGKEVLNEDEYAGLVLMNEMTKGDCLHCHTTDSDPLGTNGLFSNNGLDNASDPFEYSDRGQGGVTGDPADFGKFRIPSLRNVALTAPYMHDGRFATLEEVLDFYSEGVKQGVNIDSKMGLAHQGGVQLSGVEKRQIIAFLKTLTDSAFITDPEFGNPFMQNHTD